MQNNIVILFVWVDGADNLLFSISRRGMATLFVERFHVHGPPSFRAILQAYSANEPARGIGGSTLRPYSTVMGRSRRFVHIYLCFDCDIHGV